MTNPTTARTPETARTVARLTVSVDNNHCHLYAICQQEAPQLFQITGGRLRYIRHVAAADLEAARHAARLCPMQAIHLDEGRS